MTIKDICEFLWMIEDKYDLFNKKIDNVYFWKLVRYSIYNEITKKLNLLGQAHTKEKQFFLERIKHLPRMLINTYVWSVHRRNNPKDILVFQHERKALVDGDYIDIYTDDLIKLLKRDNRSYEIIDKPYLRMHYNKPSKQRSYLENQTITYLLKKRLFYTRLNNQEKSFIKNISEVLSNEFGIIVDLEKITREKVRDFKLKSKQYKKLLVKRNVKHVFIVVSYSWEPLIAACNELNIRCTELQHGTMGKYHLGYSFPNRKHVPYFPSELFLFGEYWYDATPLPVSRDDIKIIGYPYLDNELRKYREYKKNEYQILFISQGTVGSRLSELAYQAALRNPEFTIVFKLHPGEYSRWKREYPVLEKAGKLPNFEIIKSSSKSLYEYLATSKYLIGVYSTAIFEGLVLKCNTILVDLPGVEYMEYLIEYKYARLAKNINDIEKLIKENQFKSINKDYFFKTA